MTTENYSYDGVKALAKSFNAVCLENEPMSGYTSFKIGGKADILIKINSEALLFSLIQHLKQNAIPYFVIGKGSNLLISDDGIRGVVLLLGADFSDISVNGDIITCSAGASLAQVCKAALENSLTGLEFAYGIPGTVGGALYMNAGAYGGEMKDIAISCRYIDDDGIKEMTAQQMQLSYRHSAFFENGGCITSVTLQLKKGDREEINAAMQELIKRRREKQPLEYPSAGSTFKRPEGDFAARLIEQCGLKGAAVGDAEVSEKHSGFVINKGKATFADVLQLIDLIKERVKAQTGVTLECEVRIINQSDAVG